jgi:hypothetical protein
MQTQEFIFTPTILEQYIALCADMLVTLQHRDNPQSYLEAMRGAS